MRRLSDCHPERENVGHGLCSKCYGNARYHKTLPPKKVPYERVKFWQAYREKHPCVDCGRYDLYYLMEFDHVPERGTKIRSPITSSSRTKDGKKELEKCDLVCIRCHAIRTHKRGQKGRHNTAGETVTSGRWSTTEPAWEEVERDLQT